MKKNEGVRYFFDFLDGVFFNVLQLVEELFGPGFGLGALGVGLG
jgi:hypothetical protein